MNVPCRPRLVHLLLWYLQQSDSGSVSISCEMKPDGARVQALRGRALHEEASTTKCWRQRWTYHNAAFKYASYNSRTRARRLWQWYASCMQSRIAGVVGEVEAGHIETSSRALGQVDWAILAIVARIFDSRLRAAVLTMQ
jgi:hypothetical protein